ncbi:MULTISPECIES: VOC family protein [Cohnella]|uniref:VOC family protein n=1 Tax=Cohnella TaxID=329857 RepID=UPI0009B99D25|nr:MULTISPECIES: VOC family protein [Cohnella]MBN2983713.1 VOC family protein [Cohnella algarum]
MGILKPYIISEDARAQADFYLRSLGGEIVSVITHGEAMGAENEFRDKVMHMCLSVAGSNYIFMADAVEPFAHGTGLYLSIEYKTAAEAGEAFAKLAEGGKVKYPFELQPFGLYLGEATDRYGVSWMITSEPKTE